MIERRIWSTHRQFVTAAVVAMLLAGLLGGMLLWQTLTERGHALDVARLRLQQQATVLAEHASRSLEAVDLLLASAIAYRDVDQSPGHWYNRLQRTQLFLPQLFGLQVFDANGRLVFDGHRTSPQPFTFADQAFFHAHRDQRRAFFLDRPTRLGGRWLMPLSRRMEDAGGSFAGVLRALVDIGYFGEFYSHGESGDLSHVVLFDHQGTVYANWTPQQPAGPVGGNAADLLHLPPDAVWHDLQVQVQEESLLALTRLADFPLTLAAVRWRQEVLAPWRTRFTATLTGLVLLSVGSIGFLWLWRKQMRLRCRIEQTLRLYERALAASTNGIVITERRSPRDHPIVYANPGFAALTGYDPGEVLGKDPRLLHRDDREQPALEAIRQAVAREETIQTTLRNYRRDGTPFWCEVLISPVRDDKGRVRHFLGVQRDVSDQRRAAVELERMNRELAGSNAELEQFAYVASHDLQQPLRTIASYLTLLQRHLGDSLDEDGRTFIGFAVDGAKRMHELIVDLLEYSRITRRGVPFETVDCDRILAEAQQDLRLAIAETHTTLEISRMPGVWGDPAQIRRLFENLIGNAIKYVAPGRPPVVRILAERDGEMWRFCVEDNGIGIPPEARERVFLIFQRLHTRGDYPGNGIGLAVCRKIVERHGGRMWVESEVSQGSRFYFTLPETAPE